MFTGLVEEKGRVISINNGDKSIKLKIKASKVLENVKLGDSIATNGVCNRIFKRLFFSRLYV